MIVIGLTDRLDVTEALETRARFSSSDLCAALIPEGPSRCMSSQVHITDDDVKSNASLSELRLRNQKTAGLFARET